MFYSLPNIHHNNGCTICVDIMTGEKLSSSMTIIGQFIYPVGGGGMGLKEWEVMNRYFSTLCVLLYY